VRSRIAEAQAEGRELLGDLEVCEGRGEGDVGVAAVIALPRPLGVDGADAGNGAVDDVDHALEPGLAGRGDVPPFTVGLKLHFLALAGLAVAAVGAVDLAGPGVAVDDQDAVPAVLVGRQVLVQRRAADADDPGDLACGELAIVVHALRLVELGAGELRRPAANSAAGAGGGEPFEGALDDHLPVELGQRGEDAEEQAAERGGCVDALLEHDEVDAVLLEPLHQCQQVLVVAADPAQPGDHDHVAAFQFREQLVEFGAGGELA
jgi:hypothetical protein